MYRNKIYRSVISRPFLCQVLVYSRKLSYICCCCGEEYNFEPVPEKVVVVDDREMLGQSGTHDESRCVNLVSLSRKGSKVTPVYEWTELHLNGEIENLGLVLFMNFLVYERKLVSFTSSFTGPIISSLMNKSVAGLVPLFNNVFYNYTSRPKRFNYF